MTAAAPAAGRNPQLALDLGPDAPLPIPPHGELVAAALQNQCVRDFIADRVPTWSEGGVGRNPPCCLVYDHGEVVGTLRDLPGMIRHAEKRRGMGRRLHVRALRPDEEVLPFMIGLRRFATHPRRIRYEKRMALKRMLARGDRRAIRWAKVKNQGAFLAWAESQPGLGSRIADATGLALVEFWRTVRRGSP